MALLCLFAASLGQFGSIALLAVLSLLIHGYKCFTFIRVLLNIQCSFIVFSMQVFVSLLNLFLSVLMLL